MRFDVNVEIPMRDGTLLRADVIGADENSPRPALLIRTPYSKDAPATRCEDSAYPTEFAKSGYAVVIQDTRGRFTSDGEWGGLDWSSEGPDGYDTVEWIAAQPWCNGRVVMSGLSYPGTCATLAAAEQPPHLAAIAVCDQTEGSIDRDSMSGAFRLDLFLPWLVFMIAQDVLPKQIAAGTATADTIQRISAAVADPRLVLECLPLRKNPYLEVPGAPLTVDDLLDADYGATPAFDLSRISVPTLMLGSWYDLFTRGTIEMFRALRAEGGGGEAVRDAHRLIVGPWTHGVPGVAVGELNFGLTSAFDAVWRPLLEGFHAGHSGLAEVPDTPRVQYFLMGANEWRTAPEWPPPEVTLQQLFLHSTGRANCADGDGLLSSVAPGFDEPPDSFDYDPMNPVPTRGGGVLGLGGTVPGPLDQAVVEQRDDVLCYTSDVFREALDIVGPVRVQLRAASSAVDTDFVAKVCDVFPDGRSINVCEGLRRARHRHGFDEDALLEPGIVEDYMIDLGHTAWRVLPGHRLRLQITSSNFPNWDRNMNTGNPIGVDEAGVVANQTVHHSAEQPSFIELSVLPA